jgi:hypothetical protein
MEARDKGPGGPASYEDEPPRERALDLGAAIRRARVLEAERSGAVVELHGLETARLAELAELVAGIVRQVPPQHAILFEGGLAPGPPPRLWVDVLAFVEMARDRRTYRFVRDAREGRITLIESTDAEEVSERVVAYVAHRLIERERALASDTLPRVLPATPSHSPAPPSLEGAMAEARGADEPAASTPGPTPSAASVETASAEARAPEPPPSAKAWPAPSRRAPARLVAGWIGGSLNAGAALAAAIYVMFGPAAP